MQRLGRNFGRYQGETIEIEEVRREAERLARSAGWREETFLDQPGLRLRAYHRPRAGARRNLYLSSGTHGDEPAGPLAVLDLLREDDWPEANLWLVPCLNPAGFRLNTRENAQGIDLNRDYRHRTAPEVIAHVRWLDRQPSFDLNLLLHEDWEANGFYVYELNPDNKPSLAETMVEAVRALCPIETGEWVDTWPCRGGIIRPEADPIQREQWAEALYLIVHKSRQSYTIETPSDFPLDLRVRAQVQAVRAALAAWPVS